MELFAEHTPNNVHIHRSLGETRIAVSNIH